MRRKTPLARLVGLTSLAVCGFAVAGLFASTGIANLTTTISTGTNPTTTITTTTAPEGGEGCTPGYWKTDQHQDSWMATGYSPNQSLESVFDVPNSFGIDNITLRQALGPPTPGALNGGGVNALMRHAVAALLNSAHPGVDFALSTASVIADTNTALATLNSDAIEDQKEEFADENEEGCPLD